MTTAVPRDQRRERTAAAILTAARELFAESGFERTTIRAVAARAGIDPALVMQYYGSKERLFAEAARWQEDSLELLDVPVEDLPEAALRDLFAHFEDGDRAAAAALMRNCLTYPAAGKVVRDDMMCQRMRLVADKLTGTDAGLRAALFGALMMGVGMSRYLLDVPEIAAASREDLQRVVLPALRALLQLPAPEQEPAPEQ